MLGMWPTGFLGDAHAEGGNQQAAAQFDEIGIDDGAFEFVQVVFVQQTAVAARDVAKQIDQVVFGPVDIQIRKRSRMGLAPGLALVVGNALVGFTTRGRIRQTIAPGWPRTHAGDDGLAKSFGATSRDHTAMVEMNFQCNPRSDERKSMTSRFQHARHVGRRRAVALQDSIDRGEEVALRQLNDPTVHRSDSWGRPLSSLEE